MIKPIDIQKKEFTKAVRGYKEDEVNEFLDEITLSMEQLLSELKMIKEENSRLAEEISRLRGSEGTVVETLEAAKSLMTDISASAEKRASILLKNAELDAELMLKEAREQSHAITKETDKMKKRYEDFRNKYIQLLQSELQRFDNLAGETISAFDIKDFDDLPMGGDAPMMDPMSGTMRNLK